MQEENQTETEQTAPPQNQSTDNPTVNQKITPEDEAYYENNYSKRLVGAATGVFLILLAVVGLFIINSIGLEASTYAEASRYDDYSTNLKFFLAAVTGVTLAYIVNHPVKPKLQHVRIDANNQPQPATSKTSDAIWITFIVIGLLFFYLPGLILLAIYLIRKEKAKKNPGAGQDASKFRKVAMRPAIGTGTLLVAFIMGAFPAFIIGLIIGYPLSQHACDLSGSKYC